jgi:ribosomal-protein-alanine acetyltransferase
MTQAGMTHPDGLRIVAATQADLPELMAIGDSGGSAAQWTRQHWQDIFRTEIPRRLSWVAWAAGDASNDCAKGAVGTADRAATHSIAPSPAPPSANQAGSEPGLTAVGFLVAQCGGPEWELENMAVVRGFRRRGVGRALLETLLEAARAGGAERILLEVRTSNLAAIGLYGHAGFAELGRRPGYYRNPPEDALIMVQQL